MATFLTDEEIGLGAAAPGFLSDADIGLTAPAAPAQAPEPEQLSWWDIAANFIPSAKAYGEALAQPFLHPVQTAQGIGNVALGAVQLLVPGEQGAEEYARALGEFYADRYGGWQNLKRTIIKDPVGFLADAAMVATAGGKALQLAGQAGKLGTVARAGERIAQVGRAIEPLSIGGEIAKRSTRGVLQTLGQQGQFVKEATRATPTFRQFLHGARSGEEIVEAARDALQSMKALRGERYRAQLERIGLYKGQIVSAPIDSVYTQWLKRFNLRPTPGGGLEATKGALRSIDDASLRDVQRLQGIMDEWHALPAKTRNTPVVLDALKKRLDDFAVEGRASGAMATSLKDTVRRVLTDQVPGYEEMTRGYRQASEHIDNLQRSLSLGKRSNIDTALRKLVNTMKRDDAFAQDMINALAETSGMDLRAAIAGYHMRQWAPAGLIGKASGAGALLLGIASQNPIMGAAMAAASPRVVGELGLALGMAAQKAQPVTRLFGPGPRMAAYQIGRLDSVLPAPEGFMWFNDETGETRQAVRAASGGAQ